MWQKLTCVKELEEWFKDEGKGNFDERRLLSETVFERVYLKDGRISKAELNAPLA